jgi:hypothetical protein
MQETIVKRMYVRACCLAVLAASTCIVHAASDRAPPGQPAGHNDTVSGKESAPRTDTTAPATWGPTPGFGPPADLGKLERSRGGADTHEASKLTGIVTGNSATNVVTGNNVIDAGAFANMSGIPVVIQNSGANVLIQNSTVVNLQLK